VEFKEKSLDPNAEAAFFFSQCAVEFKEKSLDPNAEAAQQFASSLNQK
jgi:phosphoribosylformylglycinamidine (FGAM) synthase PurS component